MKFGTNALEKHLCEMLGVRNIHDDIIVFGKSRQEHDMALNQCLEKLATIGITLRKSKCKFLQTELTFFGHTYSKNGIKPDKERINDILNLETPSSIREVRSFLGMLNYSSKFIGDFSTTASSLRDMIKGNEFEWNQTHEKVFNKLKQKLASSPVMTYFDVDKETYLHIDASPFGLSGILMQKQKQSGDFRIIAYGSRSLSNVETRYSQTERGALAIVWGVEHFHQYVYGSHFVIVTDHKPLEIIYGNRNSKPSARIERWVLHLQPYSFSVEYKQGKDNPADYMPRHPAENNNRQEYYTEQYIQFIAKHSIPKAMTRHEIAEATRKDELCNKVKKALETNEWDDRNLKAFRTLKNEFSIASDGIILRGTRILIPHELRKRTIELAHEAHQGLDKTKALIRESIWFPNIDIQIKDMIENCIPCLATGVNTKPEPINKNARGPIGKDSD